MSRKSLPIANAKCKRLHVIHVRGPVSLGVRNGKLMEGEREALITIYCMQSTKTIGISYHHSLPSPAMRQIHSDFVRVGPIKLPQKRLRRNATPLLTYWYLLAPFPCNDSSD